MNYFRFIFRSTACAALALAGVSSFAQAVALATTVQAAPAIVGEATMVIGVARLISADGVKRNVERGTSISVGDRVETEAGGHVHFRFVDGGRVSIRPSSRLQVESYSHSAQASQTAIKFRLDEGVVRSITGAWGEAARERFRLNTPVAAIGIKGTDFVVRSDSEKTAASVYTGAIILSPMESDCVATLGPCRMGREKLLSEDMKGQMLELSRQQATPQLVPLVDLMAQHRRSAVGEAQASRMEKATVVASAAREELTADKAVVTEARSAGVVAAGSSAAPAPLPPAAPVVNQLAWARFEWAAKIDGDTLSRSFEEASAAGRVSTVGNGAYGLFRSAASDNALLQTTDTSANFRLAGGVGQLATNQLRGVVIEPVKVDSGTLNVDFTRSTFATALNLSNPTIGSTNLTAGGIVRPNGYLAGQTGNGFVAGALSVDGKEAGYFFSRSLPAGDLSGITVWGR